MTGLFALGLAEAGHTGPRNILESARLYSFSGELSLGSSPHICRTYFKLYSCCRHLHSPVDALLQLIDRHGIDASAVVGGARSEVSCGNVLGCDRCAAEGAVKS